MIYIIMLYRKARAWLAGLRIAKDWCAPFQERLIAFLRISYRGYLRTKRAFSAGIAPTMPA